MEWGCADGSRKKEERIEGVKFGGGRE